MYLVKEDLYSHIYPEIVDTISRENDNIITKALIAGVTETKAYLSKFDLLALFGDDTTPPTITDDFLKLICSQVAAWNLCKLSNPNINLELLRTNYLDAIKTLEKIQKGTMDPEWPRKGDNTITTGFNEGQTINWKSNPKKTHHF